MYFECRNLFFPTTFLIVKIKQNVMNIVRRRKRKKGKSLAANFHIFSKVFHLLQSEDFKNFFILCQMTGEEERKKVEMKFCLVHTQMLNNKRPSKQDNWQYPGAVLLLYTVASPSLIINFFMIKTINKLRFFCSWQKILLSVITFSFWR